MDIMYRQDSLQRIAALSPPIRDAFLKRLAKLLRKQQGLKDQEEDDGSGGSTVTAIIRVSPTCSAQVPLPPPQTGTSITRT
jgi:hypothetical protein